MSPSGEDVDLATPDELLAAAEVVDAVDEFFRTLRRDHGVPDEEMVPLDMADLHNIGQAIAFFRMVAERGRIR